MISADRRGWFGQAPSPDRDKYHDKYFLVVNVLDGDTFDIDSPDGQYERTRIRLWGVDTPETVKPDTPVQHFGREASEFTRTKILGQTVRVELENRQNRDKYGRLLAWIFLEDGTLLNELIIEQGMGYADPRFAHSRSRQLSHLQNQARKAGKGLWADVKEQDLPYYFSPDQLPPGGFGFQATLKK